MYGGAPFSVTIYFHICLLKVQLAEHANEAFLIRLNAARVCSQVAEERNKIP